MSDLNQRQGEAALPKTAVYDPLMHDPAMFVEQRFNHDLLVDDNDQQLARLRWPTVAPLLIDLNLIAQFKPFEAEAKRLKSLVQWLGSIAVLLMFIALFASAFELWNSGGSLQAGLTSNWTGILVEVCGILGLGLALLASKYGPFRRSWLQNRFVTEVLRQWHFRQLLDTRAWQPQPQWDSARFEQQRAADLRALQHDLRGVVGQRMDLLVNARIDPVGEVPKAHIPNDVTAQRELIDAYRRLRLDHQIEFAEYKLSPDDRTFLGLSLEALVSTTNQLAGAALVLALGCSIARLFQPLSWVSFAAIALAVVGVAVRAWRDGLSLREERERYDEMRHRLGLLRARWHSAANDGERFTIAEEVEQAAAEELRSFIHSHMTAQFLF